MSHFTKEHKIDFCRTNSISEYHGPFVQFIFSLKNFILMFSLYHNKVPYFKLFYFMKNS